MDQSLISNSYSEDLISYASLCFPNDTHVFVLELWLLGIHFFIKDDPPCSLKYLNPQNLFLQKLCYLFLLQTQPCRFWVLSKKSTDTRYKVKQTNVHPQRLWKENDLQSLPKHQKVRVNECPFRQHVPQSEDYYRKDLPSGPHHFNFVGRGNLEETPQDDQTKWAVTFSRVVSRQSGT